jgi:FtsH-binding integral membrane protein
MTTYTNTASNSYDESLRAFMLSLYNHTAAGLGISGVVAYLTYASGLMTAMGPSDVAVYLCSAWHDLVLDVCRT